MFRTQILNYRVQPPESIFYAAIQPANAENPPVTRTVLNVSRASTTTVALACALAAAACSGAARSGEETTPRPGATSTAELEALYRARTDSARMRFTEADVHFMTGMIAHHAQALVMSALAPTHGASPAVQILAARIINAQKDEIATIQQWLRDRGQAVPEHHMHMPGMLTRDQLDELDRARGAAFDRLFLTYMIQHHQGAVTMVHDLFATDGAAQDEEAFKLASDIQVDQITEIARMELMLSELP